MSKSAQYQPARQARAAQIRAASKPVEVTFRLERPDAREVYVCGDFNEWVPASLRMVRRPDNGHWEKRLTLAPGRYQYKFIVDGEWVHNPDAPENVPNPHGTLNSVVEI